MKFYCNVLAITHAVGQTNTSQSKTPKTATKLFKHEHYQMDWNKNCCFDYHPAIHFWCLPLSTDREEQTALQMGKIHDVNGIV